MGDERPLRPWDPSAPFRVPSQKPSRFGIGPRTVTTVTVLTGQTRQTTTTIFSSCPFPVLDPDRKRPSQTLMPRGLFPSTSRIRLLSRIYHPRV